MAWPVPRWTSCSTKLTPVGSAAARTRSASWPMMQKMSVRGDERLGGRDDVQQKGAAADLVQHLGALALEPRALARGHDGYCETCRFHARYLLMPNAVLAPLLPGGPPRPAGPEWRCRGR